MNKIAFVLTVIVGVAIGLTIAYILKIPFAIYIIDTVKAKIASINIGGINIGSIASFASIIGLAGTTYQLIKANKDKIAAQVENGKQMIANQTAHEEIINVTNAKTELEDKLIKAEELKNKAFQTLETKTEEFKGMADEVNLLQDENDKLRQTIDTLHETLRRNKLTDEEAIVKTIVK